MKIFVRTQGMIFTGEAISHSQNDIIYVRMPQNSQIAVELFLIARNQMERRYGLQMGHMSPSLFWSSSRKVLIWKMGFILKLSRTKGFLVEVQVSVMNISSLKIARRATHEMPPNCCAWTISVDFGARIFGCLQVPIITKCVVRFASSLRFSFLLYVTAVLLNFSKIWPNFGKWAARKWAAQLRVCYNSNMSNDHIKMLSFRIVSHLIFLWVIIQ